jgi:hypothetical protein
MLGFLKGIRVCRANFVVQDLEIVGHTLLQGHLVMSGKCESLEFCALFDLLPMNSYYITFARGLSAPWLQGGTMGIYREDTGAGITIPYVRHWSWSASNEYMYFSVYSQDLTESINLVNTVFDNRGNTTHPLSLRFETFPPGETFPGPDYNPGALNAVTFVYGDGAEYGVTVPGAGRRRMGSSNRDYTVFTINWWQNGAKLTPGKYKRLR